MPVITHRSGAHRLVLSYGSRDDLREVCEAIVAMARRPELGLGASALHALAEQVAEHAMREAIGAATCRVPPGRCR